MTHRPQFSLSLAALALLALPVAAHAQATERAVFLVRQNGTIAFSRGYADFRVRPEPAEVLEALDAEIRTS